MSEPAKRAERIPPHSEEAEDAVLGVVLVSRAALSSVRAVLRPEDFYRRGNGELFAAMLALDDRGEPVDMITAAEEIKRRGTVQDVGGLLRLQEVVEYVPSTASAEHYARIIAHHATLRRLISACADAMELAYSNPPDPEKAMEEAEAMIYTVSRARKNMGILDAPAMVAALIEYVERASESRPPGVIPTGLMDLDRILQGGLHPGNLIVLGARPAVGKSAFASNITGKTLLEGHSVLFASLEMSDAEIGTRLAMDLTASDVQNTRAMVTAAELMYRWPIRLKLAPASVQSIRDEARRDLPELIVIDYLHLLTGAKHTQSRQNEVGEFARDLKLMASELHVPVLALASLNRASDNESRVPRLSDLRDSGEIESHADVVLLMHRVLHGEESGKAEIIVAKQRMGPTARIDVVYRKRLMRFQNTEIDPPAKIGPRQEELLAP